MKPCAHNLCLHYVCGNEPPAERRNTLTRAALRALLEAELEAGRTPARLEDFLKGPLGPDRFTVSFDDAHRSMLEHAAPVLAELDVPAALFVPTAFVGTSQEFMDFDGLRRLRDLGWTIGSHSVSHPRMTVALYDEDEAARALRLADECARSREALARELGAAPGLFAYPYGAHDALCREAVRAAGYDAAVTVATESTWASDLFAIPRVEPASPDEVADGPVGISVVVPAYNRADMLAEVVTRLASQSYPEGRYEVIVVDDGSDDDLSAIFEDMPDHVRCLRHGDESFRAGQARQVGADEARFEVVAFLDADVAVAEDFLWHLDWVHRRTPDAVLLGYLSGYNLHDIGHTHRLADVRPAADLEALPLIPDRSREPTLRSCLDNLDWLTDPWRLTYTGNLSLRRRLLDAVGGFGQDFVGWGLEDVDLGYRLHRHGGRFVFSRFAVGYHMVDGTEDAARNPFRRPAPNREDFAGYLDNLAQLRARHSGDPEMSAYVEASLADIEETCGRPYTVGIECGGEARRRSPLHESLHRVVVGGMPPHELFDRVAYAAKIGARSVYLLGGAPAEHPAFSALVRRASAVVERVAMLSPVHAFATPSLAADAERAGLSAVTCLVHSFRPEVHDGLFGPGAFDEFLCGLERLAAAGLERSAHVVVSPGTLAELEATFDVLARENIRVDDVSVTEADLLEEAARLSPVPVQIAAP